MLEDINKEKTSADHLLYVSLKYTKTCDVILNLIERWRSLIDLCFDALVKKKLEQKVIKEKPKSPMHKVEFIKKYYKKNKNILDIIPLYLFFRRIPLLQKAREGEFRKKVTLKVFDKKEIVSIDLEKLKEYSLVVERFISEIKQELEKK
ncbi:MAG: hypothetical protein QW273_00365 [Candidatus Pacearchaeota archaeon]